MNRYSGITITQNLEKALDSFENSNYYEVLNYLRYESSNNLVDDMKKKASRILLNQIIEQANQNNYDNALSQLNRLRNQSGVHYEIANELNNCEKEIKKRKAYQKMEEIKNYIINGRLSDARYKLNNLKSEGYPSELNSEVDDLENGISFTEIKNLNEQQQYKEALDKIKTLLNKSNLSYNLRNIINQNKQIIISNFCYSRFQEITNLRKEEKYNDCFTKISEIKNDSNYNDFPSELKGKFINLEGCIYSDKKEYKTAIEKYENAISYNPNERIIKTNIYNCLLSLSSEFLESQNYDGIEIYVSKGLNYNPSNDYKSIFYFILAKGKEKKNEYKIAITYYNNSISSSKNLNEEEKKTVCEKMGYTSLEDVIDLFYNNLFNLIYDMLKNANENKYEEYNKMYEDEVRIIDLDEKRDNLIYLCVGADISNERFLKGYNKLDRIKDKEKKEYFMCKVITLFLLIDSYLSKDENELNNIVKINELEKYYNILINIPNENLMLQLRIKALKLPLFMAKNKILVESEKYKDVLDNIEQILKTPLNIKERNEIENFKKEVEKMYYNYLYNKGDVSKYLNENNQTDSKLKDLIKDVLNKQIDEDIDNDNLDKAEKDLEIAIKNEPDNPKLNNSLAYINYKKGDYDSALKNINVALEKEPDNKNLIGNKLELIDKQNDLTDDSKNFLVNKIIDKKTDKDIQNKALDVTLKNVENGKVELNDETMEKLLDNINDKEEENNDKKENNNNIKEENIDTKEENIHENKEEENKLEDKNKINEEDNQKINLKNNINESKTAKLISASILNKSKKEGKEGQYTINKELKNKIKI